MVRGAPRTEVAICSFLSSRFHRTGCVTVVRAVVRVTLASIGKHNVYRMRADANVEIVVHVYEGDLRVFFHPTLSYEEA